jgi:hypothetical protein
MEAKQDSRCGWSGSIAQFLAVEESKFISQLSEFIGDVKDEQVEAWRDSYHVLQKVFLPFEREEWQLIFEYELPREGGRRPDARMRDHFQFLIKL